MAWTDESRRSIRDGHADIFAHAHRCGYLHYPTYVGYSAIYADIDADIRIRMAIPGTHRIWRNHHKNQLKRTIFGVKKSITKETNIVWLFHCCNLFLCLESFFIPVGSLLASLLYGAIAFAFFLEIVWICVHIICEDHVSDETISVDIFVCNISVDTLCVLLYTFAQHLWS